MLIYKKGDLLKAKENLICHQVNEDGIMGGGLALQIANRYPNVEKNYKNFCIEYKDMLYGQYQALKIADKKYIVNCFTQRNFVTNLKDVEQVFRGLLQTCELNNFTIAVPKNYGCGIAKGNWDEVSNLLNDLSNEYEVNIVVYEWRN